MNDQSRPLTTGGTPHGTSNSPRVTRESHTRSSLITSAMASGITTSSATEIGGAHRRGRGDLGGARGADRPGDRARDQRWARVAVGAEAGALARSVGRAVGRLR